MTATVRDQKLVGQVLACGFESLRDLPWRRTRDPWTVLVSETMLQQTQALRVADRLPRFLERFPTVAQCAAAPASAVVQEWSGLGYNRRPLNLHRAARIMVDQHQGHVPNGLVDLLALPGVGPYTARAVRAFAFEEPAAVVDTNIGRILARVDGRTLGAAQAQTRADVLAESETTAKRYWWWNQSLMELAALVCTKRTPACERCPLADLCRWRGQGPDPAVGSAAVSGKQSTFAGSDRQLRGRLVEALRVTTVPVVEVATVIGCSDPDRVARVIAGLERDGLLERRRGRLMLPTG